MNVLKTDIRGQLVNYYEWGTKGKPTLVCLHGLCNTGLSFWELAEIMKDEYHVVVFDNPGHGNTSAFLDENQYLFSEIAKWYDYVFQKITEGPFLILGHSWGADIALHCSITVRHRIKGTILLDGGFTFPENEPGMTFSAAYSAWDAYMDGAKYLTVEDVLNEYKGYSYRWNGQIEQMVLSMFKSEKQYELITSKHTVLSVIKGFFAEPFSTTYPHISVPVLLLHATIPEDNVARENGILQLKNSVGNVTIVAVNNAGHMLHWDNPLQVYNEIKRWASGFLTS